MCAHDNDNIVLNKFFHNACRTLDQNPEVAAVVGWLRYFNDGEDWAVETHGPGYRPIGCDMGMGLRINIFGDALAVYRTDVLKKMGGWDGSSRAKWEDWQLFARLVAQGHQVWIIPVEQALYRVRASSMVRTYPDFPGWERLTDVLTGLPKAQAISIVRSIWTPSVPLDGCGLAPVGGELQRLRQEAEALRLQQDVDSGASIRQEAQWLRERLGEAEADLVRLRLIEASTIWRATRGLRIILKTKPRLRAIMRKPLALTWRGARRVIRFARWAAGPIRGPMTGQT